MADQVPRLRVFAGPNGSGKSTIRNDLRAEWIGYYVNADEIEKILLTGDRLSLEHFGLKCELADLQAFLASSSFSAKTGTSSSSFGMEHNSVYLNAGTSSSYHSAILADFIRSELLKRRLSFTFETVMSHRSKVDLLRQAKLLGYRTYLYFIATETPQINVDRVALRVSSGGHNVPEEKIRERYERSLALLPEAIYRSDRAFIFDNSGDLDQRICFAEFEGGTRLSLRSKNIPLWFQRRVLDLLEPSDS